jgi:hypothetical protein
VPLAAVAVAVAAALEILLPQHSQRPLNDLAISLVFLTQGLFCQQQPLKVDGFDGDAIQVESLRIRLQRFKGVVIRIEKNVNHKRVGHSDFFAFLEPGNVNVFGRLIWQGEQGTFTCCPACADAGTSRSISVVARW